VAAKPVEYRSPQTALPLSPGSGDDAGAALVRWLFPAYIFVILLGFFALRVPGVMPGGNELNPDRAVFTSVNAATLTGFQYTIGDPADFFMPGKVIVLCLTIFGTLFTLIVGGLAVKRILRLNWSDRRIYVAAFIAEAFVLIMGAFASAGEGHSMIGSMMQTAAAWGNSGVRLEAAPTPDNIYTHIVLLPLAVLGGFGLVVVLQIFDALVRGVPMLRHSRLVLQMSAALFLIGFIGCVLLQLMDLESIGKAKIDSWPEAAGRLFPKVFTNASIMSLNVRTAGMNLIPITSRPLSFFVMLLMMIGASPGGTGGGLKTTTLYELITAPARILRGQPLSRTTGIAITWLGIYLIALAFFQIMLLWAEPPMPGDRVLFVTISALSNVGLSHDNLSMTRSSLLLVSAAMFFGRIVPLLILWWMVDTTRDAELAVG
jgi:trk system potassium uptake protein TrkH